METELQKIEREMQKLRDRKKEILDEVRAKKDSEKKERKAEVEQAYKHFIELLEMCVTRKYYSNNLIFEG